MTTGCAIATPNTVYAWPSKEDFDKLALPEKAGDWKPNEVTTLLKKDGQQWERQCHYKVIEGNGVMVIFQWFDERPIAAVDNQVEG